MKVSCTCSGWILLGAILASPVAQAASPFIVGVCSHLMYEQEPTGQANRMMRDAGISSVRIDAHWGHAERARGRLLIEPSWKRYLAGTESYGLATMFILGYGNYFYGDGKKPRTQPVRDAFERYAGFIAESFKGRVTHYEIWNEWDHESPRDPQFSRDYVKLVAQTTQRLRKTDPNARILAGAVTSEGIQSGFAQRIVDDGVMDLVDGLSLHPYVHCYGSERSTPEAWINWMREVDADLSERAGRPVPLYLTEMAWPAHEGHCGFPERVQAAYLARSYLLARTVPNIKGMWWYDIRNDGTNPKEREHNFGLLRQDMQIKPAYEVLAAISEVVVHYVYDGIQQSDDPDVMLLRFSRGQDQLLAGWSIGKPRQVRIRSTAGAAGKLELIDTERAIRRRHSSTAEWHCSDGNDCLSEVILNEFPKLISLGAASTELSAEKVVLPPGS